LANYKESQITTFVSDKFLDVNHRAKLFEHLERARGERLIVDSRDTASFGSKQRFDDNVPAQSVECVHSTVQRLADNGSRHHESSSFELCRRKILVDRCFDGSRRIDYWSPARFQSAEYVHPEYHLFE
jgi:hypothetical protein